MENANNGRYTDRFHFSSIQFVRYERVLTLLGLPTRAVADAWVGWSVAFVTVCVCVCLCVSLCVYVCASALLRKQVELSVPNWYAYTLWEDIGMYWPEVKRLKVEQGHVVMKRAVGVDMHVDMIKVKFSHTRYRALGP